MPLTITHTKSITIADFTGTVTAFNSSGGTTTQIASNMARVSDWNANHGIVFSLSGSEIYSGGMWEPFPGANTNSSLSAPGVGTWYLDPIMVPHALGSGQLNFLAADAAGFLNGGVFSAASSGSITRYQTLNTQAVLYQIGTGASTSRIESVWSKEVSELFTWERRIGTTTTSNATISNYLTASFPAQWDASGNLTYSTTSQSGTVAAGASTGASTIADSLISGAVAYVSGSKMIPVPFATQLAAGDYYLGVMISSTSSSTGTNYSTGTMMSTQSMVGMLEFVNRAYKRLGQSVSNSSTAMFPYHGSVATTSTAPISPLNTSDMRNFATNHRRVFNYVQSTY